jgi:hypothetical protein
VSLSVSARVRHRRGAVYVGGGWHHSVSRQGVSLIQMYMFSFQLITCGWWAFLSQWGKSSLLQAEVNQYPAELMGHTPPALVVVK